jgi:hypothetical protein
MLVKKLSYCRPKSSIITSRVGIPPRFRKVFRKPELCSATDTGQGHAIICHEEQYSMSAGAAPLVDRDLGKLAPKFRAAVELALGVCNAKGLDAYVYEAYRSPELQALYYARGRTIIPPERPVTNARSNLWSWHGYGLGVDVISRSQRWEAGYDWFAAVAAEFELVGCKWGGTWKSVDLPHHQWGRCKPSPSDRARELYRTGGFQAVWEAVGAA